jgi:hypothetical protein
MLRIAASKVVISDRFKRYVPPLINVSLLSRLQLSRNLPL